MEGWRQLGLWRRKIMSNKTQTRTLLTPTGRLMEGVYTQNSGSGVVGETAMLRRLVVRTLSFAPQGRFQTEQL